MRSVVGLALLLPLVAQAALSPWQIVPATSYLTFTATQNGTPVNGTFRSFTGTLMIDPVNYQSSQIEIVVDIASLFTSYSLITTTLVKPEWFDAKQFPKAVFKSTQFTKTGDNSYQAKGTLSIRDKTAPVTVSFKTEQPSENTGVVTGSTVIQRNTFGVGQGEWSKTSEIKDEVTVNFKVTAVKSSEQKK